MRKLLIKFPSQIRISGWDFGSSARAMNQAGEKDALMTYESVSKTQADLEKVSKSTTERKSMSTKTTIKRIALVAVSALGLGMVTSVAANAGDNEATAVTVSAQAPARAGAQSAVALTISGTWTASSGVNYVAAKVTSAPSTSSTSAITFESIPTSGSRAFAVDGGSQAIYGTVGSTTASTVDTATAYTTWTAGSSTTTGKLNLLFTPHVAGTYQILVWANATSYSAGKPSAVISITTAGAPTSAVLTPYSSTFAASNAANDGLGTQVKVVLKDASGNPTLPNANESIDLSASGQATVTTVGINSDAQSAGEVESFGSSSFKYGELFVPVDNTAAETFTLTASISGTSSGTLGSVALTTKAAATGTTYIAAGAEAIPSALVTLSTNNYGGFTVYNGATATNLTTQSIQTTVVDPGAAKYIGWEIVDTDGYVTGNVGATVHPVSAIADDDTKAYYSVAASLGLLTTSQYTIEPITGASVTASTGTALVVTGGTAAAHTVSNGTPSVLRLATGGSPTVKIRVTDQFGGGVAGAAVTASISGRNALTTYTTAWVTDASGYVNFTYTDASTSTTVLTDTITFTASVTGSGSDGSGTATVNFGTVTVDDVEVTGAASEDVAPSVTYTNISAGTSGPHGGAVAITATITDANGSVLSGVPVTFSVDKGLIQKTATTDYTTVYTGTDGTAVTYVLGWTTGKATVTATAGGKTGTGYINWKSGTTTANAQAAARVLSGSVNKDIVSLKVVDRFGNPVANAAINLTRTGTGLFGNGASTQDVTTDENGTADVRFSGTGTVTAKLSESYTQAYAAADKVAGVTSAPVAFTAPTAGTTIGTGSTFAPAGVASVSLDVTDSSSDSVDAANEATDAANAATDAANAAAEAADAATAAAQDAQAAVAALATEVAAMISGIKAQIIRLTNLVVKIQKKVNA